MERFDIAVAQFRVFVTRRPKYARRSFTDAIAQAPAPAWLIPGGMSPEATFEWTVRICPKMVAKKLRV